VSKFTTRLSLKDVQTFYDSTKITYICLLIDIVFTLRITSSRLMYSVEWEW